MSKQDYEAAVAAFIRAKGVTRCPTACVSPTQSIISDGDRAALRRHAEIQEQARLAKYRPAGAVAA
jgi:hypothetical protein